MGEWATWISQGNVLSAYGAACSKSPRQECDWEEQGDQHGESTASSC